MAYSGTSPDDATVDVVERNCVAKRARVTIVPLVTDLIIEVDEPSHRVWSAGVEVAMTPNEFRILRYLLTNIIQVLTRTQILDHVWNYEVGGQPSRTSQRSSCGSTTLTLLVQR